MSAMAVCSDGTTVENPKALAASLKQLRKVDKAIVRSRNVHGKSNSSNRRERLYARRGRVHARIVNVRNDHHHKVTTAIAKSAGHVMAETLNVAGMAKNRRLARAIADAGMSGLPHEAGVQVPVVWSGAREGGPLVCVVQAVRPLWLEERRPYAFRP